MIFKKKINLTIVEPFHSNPRQNRGAFSK
jgi:hypothetical protein